MAFTGITASGINESQWLSTDAAPTVAPNTGNYFCPALYLNYYCPEGTGAASSKITIMIELTITVDCKGMRMLL